MIQSLFGKFLLEGFLIFAATISFGFLKNKLGNDRAETIKDSLLAAMLWAEEEFGIGEGNKKWEEAWKKLLEILKDKKINLKTRETRELQTLMKANIHLVNKVYYDSLLKKNLYSNQNPESIIKLNTKE